MQTDVSRQMIEYNEVIEKLPLHLKQFVVDQQYNHYTPVDQAVWRYVMRQNYNHLSKVAHGSYVEGLHKTGIGIESIAQMYGMNRILKEIGWAAVAVDGFIPPAAFMEFQAYKVLVIAADIRQLEHIQYTPAPDILHEAAGHAPIIADPEYAEYLRHFGEIGSKTFSSEKDYELYEAIRHLSIIKEYPDSSAEEIAEAEKDIERIQAEMGEMSEMARLRNLHWWTVEYGLIGTLEEFKIYGAGLLSSIGESATCMDPKVKKLPYTVDAANISFDITKPQPQLFVTPSFNHLMEVLEQFANTLAVKRGGLYGLHTAIKSKNTGTAVYSSGLQVSGTFTNVIADGNGNVAYLQTTGPTALAYANKELPGHGKDYHVHGFGSPVGNLKGNVKSIEDLSDAEMGITIGSVAKLEFESGVVVQGIVTKKLTENGKTILLSFENCTVILGDKVLFEPAWGTYDMAVGAVITAVFSGAADAEAFKPTALVPKELTKKISYTDDAKRLHALYGKVRDIRNTKQGVDELQTVFNTVKEEHPNDWLLSVEILEILKDSNLFPKVTAEVEQHLAGLKNRKPEYTKLIDDGIRLANEFELLHF